MHALDIGVWTREVVRLGDPRLWEASVMHGERRGRGHHQSVASILLLKINPHNSNFDTIK